MGILELVKAYQLDVMLFMGGMCALLVYLTAITGALSPRRKHILMLLESTVMLLLLTDRCAYLYRGDVSTTGYWMVRISNFLVYLCTLAMPSEVSLYLSDLYANEGEMQELPKRLTACKALFVVGAAMLVISQFTGLYYTFDAQNRYQRAPGIVICYATPLFIVMLQLSVLVQYRRLLGGRVVNALALHLVIPAVASVVQLFTYGISLTNMTAVFVAIYLYICALHDMNETLEQARLSEIETYEEARQRERTLFEQTAEALASAIDAKDEYTHGHSSRVAMYSGLIAHEAGLSDDECEKVYFAALLHDVGKIGIADAIINKEGKLTEEEFAQIKLHPVFGHQILSSIREEPYLSVGAHYHHERYDGHGYPEGLAGEDIPQLARIIAVADAYDAMTSQRSYRDVRPQHLVREELVKGMGTQFDPRYARIMLHYMDLDLEYHMHQQLEGLTTDLVSGLNAAIETELRCDDIYHDCSTGIRILEQITRIRFVCTSDEGFDATAAQPSLILFDSLDGLVHQSAGLRKDRRYFEYAQVSFDGHTVCTEARKAETKVIRRASDAEAPRKGDTPRSRRYEIEVARFYDHVQVRIFDQVLRTQTIVALPFSGRFSYLSLTGTHCTLSDIQVEHDRKPIADDYIPRIADQISYMRGYPEGDIPNIQIEGHRARTTQGIPLSGTTRIAFHAQTLPNARLVWHCPYISVFASQDGTVDGEDFEELALVRLDGEELVGNVHTLNEDVCTKTPDFEGWDAWKRGLKEGVDCEALIRREPNSVSIEVACLGIVTRSVTPLPAGTHNVYAAFTGDQCTITNIRILR